ncbi:hypothetical protein [Pseudomonas koreensis]|jgi:hypothetical protein|uniref:hypothetical protein n=1 Tax=Pseudomonas koreensis TaxID=198620 RepID=UPI000E276349|nr:hypothetical protein [Pseudomonas koreensis]MBP3998332.1 hypothetical protein [Pseudomonas koreensis]
MSDLHAAIKKLQCEPDTSNHAERLAFKRGHKQARDAAAELASAQLGEADLLRPDAAVAAIQFALDDDDGMQFLRLWNDGDFDVIRSEWPEAPEEVFIGADPLHKTSK